MKVSQVIRSIKSTPSLWTIHHDTSVVMSFKWESYIFLKFTKDAASPAPSLYGVQARRVAGPRTGIVKLVNKQLGVEMVWDAPPASETEAADVVGEQLWSSVIMQYLAALSSQMEA